MTIQLTADQILMCDNACRLLGDGAARSRAAGANWPTTDRVVWLAICEAGWPSLLLPEAHGGWGCSGADMVIVLEGIAGVMAPEPFGPTLPVSVLLADCGTEAASALLGRFLTGDEVTLLAERDPFPFVEHPDYVLSDAEWADSIICPVDAGDDFRLVVVAAKDLDNRWPLKCTIDGGAQRVFSLAGLDCQELGRGVAAERAYLSARNVLRLCAAATLVGLARHSLKMTVDYLKLRTQFGKPIGSFQALQHRMASAHVSCIASQALVHEAASALGTGSEGNACAMAKSRASSSAMAILKECLQMHGAIGFSDEYDLALYFRRVSTLAATYGSASSCRRDVEAA